MEYNGFQNNKVLQLLNSKNEWKLYKLPDILLDDTKNAVKIKKEDYLENGISPIIDQGQSYIAGYSNATEGLYKNNPVIIFGDHTRIIKYCDFPLFLGADGVKLLKPKFDNTIIDVKYLYYFLKTIELPSDGYSRHFKYLKEVIIPVPRLDIQLKVTEVLDKAQELIDKRKAQIEALDELVKSKFIEMFGNPLINSKGWDIKELGTMGEFKNGMNYKQSDSGFNIKFLGVGEFKYGNIINSSNELSTVELQEEPNEEYLLKNGDIVFVRSNGSKELVGRSVLIRELEEKTTYSGFCIRYRNHCKNLASDFLIHLLSDENFKKSFKKDSRGANINNLNQQMLSSLKIILPPLDLQNQFADFVNQVDKLKLKMQNSLKELETNFNSLMQRAFKGELFN